MKKYIAVIVFLFLLSAVSSAATLNKIMREETKDSLRLILDISGEAKYVVSKGNSYAVISIPNLMPLPAVPKRIKSKVLESVMIGENNGICGITAQFKYLTSLNVSTIKNPHVMIIEFRKLSKMKVPKINAPQIEMTVTPKSISTVSTAEIVVTSDEAAGLRYAKMSKDTEEGPVTVNALIADQKLLNVYPFLAHKKPGSPNFIGMVGSLFAFWGQEERTKYVKDKVSDMADETKAIAGVNGTFFGRAGEPLGILMINGELVSYSILDRTALIIDSSNRCYIDNVSLSGESQIEGRTIQISGINRKRGTGEAIVYTPKYGVQTDEDSPGIVLSVSNDEVKNICRAHARIPEDGYVLSLDPNYWDELGDKIHVGSRISTKMKLIPLSGLSNLEIKHVIGGGPRLLKSGEIYISKNSEQFKTDIAKSRAARTAVGINSDGSLVFATVDKCSESPSRAKSAGVTLEELAVIMKNLGCVEAMNLDGGSSSTMVLYDNVVNVPSGGEEKPVSNGILIGK
jgi:exopolysaccharide biosynthesis protein